MHMPAHTKAALWRRLHVPPSRQVVKCANGRTPTERHRYSVPFSLSAMFNPKPPSLRVQILLELRGRAWWELDTRLRFYKWVLQQIEFHKMTGLKIFCLFSHFGSQSLFVSNVKNMPPTPDILGEIGLLLKNCSPKVKEPCAFICAFCFLLFFSFVLPSIFPFSNVVRSNIEQCEYAYMLA